MARRKGLKRWDEITTEGWLSLMADKTVMSALMMQIFSRLYHSEDYMDNAKNIAKALHLEYRALNAGVGWAGNKIREMYESGGLLTYHASEKKDETPREEETGEFRLSETPASRIRRSPWEYVFDGSEDDNGTYFWVMKPEAVRAYREIMDADIWHLDDIRQLLESDETAYGCEGSLFSHSSSHTVDEIRKRFSKNADFKRKSMGAHPCAGQIGSLFSMRSLMGRTASRKRGSCFVRPMRHFSPHISSLFPMRASFWCLLGFLKGKGSFMVLSRERRRRHLSAAGGCLRIEKFLQRKEEN